jgi:hypothetical protein
MDNKPIANKHSAMFQRGYDNGITFAYIPDFKNQQEKVDFEAGLLEAYQMPDMSFNKNN